MAEIDNVADAAMHQVVRTCKDVLMTSDPLRRTELITRAQHELAWATRCLVHEAREEHGVSLRRLAAAMGMSPATLTRQCTSGGPVVAVAATYEPPEVVVGFRTAGGADDAWQVLTAQQAADPLLRSAVVVHEGPLAYASPYAGATLELRTRLMTTAERAARVALQPLWHPRLGRRAVLLTPEVATTLRGPTA